MDSDDDSLASKPRIFQNRASKLSEQPKKQKKSVSGGILTDFYSPTHETYESPRKRGGLYDAEDDTDDTLTFIRQIKGKSASSTRPTTAMSQADMIPDLEDMVDLESGRAVKAPLPEATNLSSYQDLEKDIMKHPAFASFESIDMTSLFSRLLPEEEVMEENTVWNWDNIIASVSSHIKSNHEN